MVDMHRAIAHLVDKPSELWHSLAWGFINSNDVWRICSLSRWDASFPSGILYHRCDTAGYALLLLPSCFLLLLSFASRSTKQHCIPDPILTFDNIPLDHTSSQSHNGEWRIARDRKEVEGNRSEVQGKESIPADELEIALRVQSQL